MIVVGREIALLSKNNRLHETMYKMMLSKTGKVFLKIIRRIRKYIHWYASKLEEIIFMKKCRKYFI